MSSFDDASLLQEFVIESRDHLASIEPDLLTLEREGQQAGAELINRVFRAIHSIKGAAGFFGLNALKNLSHAMESVLMLVRDGLLEPTGTVMDPLLAGVDKLNAMLDDIQASEHVDCQTEIQKLERILSGKGISDHSVPIAATATSHSSQATSPSNPNAPDRTIRFQADHLRVESAARQGQQLFSIQISLDQDLAAQERTPLDALNLLLSMGSILDTAFELDDLPTLADCLDANVSLWVLYASVLDSDLIAATINVPQAQITAMALEDVLAQLATEPPAPRTDAPPPMNSLTPADWSAQATTSGSQTATPGNETSAEPSTPIEPSQVATPPVIGGSSDHMETVRVRVDLLNKLMDLAGEMVLSRNQLKRTLEKDEARISGLASILQNVDLITTDLQEHIMQTRMQPISNIFGKFPRVVRDLARQTGKEIQLLMSGEDVELDKSIIESLSDPLTHLIRNSCDHGLETPDERMQSGKPAQGTIQLRAYHEGGQINIAIADDGRGINHEKVAQKAIANGAISDKDVKAMSTQEMAELIFLPGFSTAEQVTELSGRGVGMDVVKTNIEKLGGTISLETVPGKGTTILLRLPLTLAIIPSLIVGIAGERFAIPQINLVELVRIPAADISSRLEKVGTATVLRLRGSLLPLVRLSHILGLEPVYIDPQTGQVQPDRRQEIADIRQTAAPEASPWSDPTIEPDRAPLPPPLENRRRHRESDCNILVLRVGANRYGLVVDELFDTEEIVVKPMPGYLKNCKCFAGATIMGDGRVAMILDAGGILGYAKLSFNEVDEEARRRQSEANAKRADEQHQMQAVLLFNNALNEHFAIPLSAILRLEKFDPTQIETIGGREYITYRERGLPLLRLENHLPVQPAPSDLQEMYIIIPKTEQHAMAGIIASQILDTVETRRDLDKSFVQHPGIQGSAVVNGQLTLFIEPNGLLQAAGLTAGELSHV